ncbi:uncharacterized protein [Leptinotarsa decemlineata]|uniref:uncharacterized protein n=1 Tax=Leptinotarsa decemlineata TaxID=7539 RepID=UPI003D307D03
MGVRNKYYVVCKKHENKGNQPKPHRCFKNWMLSSSAMESDVIAAAFQQSLEKHGVIFKTMIADGDSSCYQKLLARDPYAEYNITVENIECRNHLLRNHVKKLADICKNKHAGPAVLRKKLRSINDYFIKTNEKIYKKYTPIIINIEIFSAIYEIMMVPVKYLATHFKSLLCNVDTNTFEQFNSIICKHIGGKRINYCSRRSFQARCEASVEWNTKHFVSILSQSLTGRMPALSKKIERKYTHRRKICIKNRAWQKSNNEDYSECCKFR